MAPDDQTIIQEITDAFDGVSREGGISLHEAEEIDCRGTPEQFAAARWLDTDQRWQDVPGTWLEEFPSVPFFLDPIGFRYYLPAYMIWSLRNEDSSSATADNVVSCLASSPRANTLFPILSAQQRASVFKWLQAMRRRYHSSPNDAEDAIAQWRKAR